MKGKLGQGGGYVFKIFVLLYFVFEDPGARTPIGVITSNERRPPMEDDLQWKTPPMEDDLQWNITSNGRQPPMEDELQWKTTSNGRRPPMEDDL